MSAKPNPYLKYSTLWLVEHPPVKPGRDYFDALAKRAEEDRQRQERIAIAARKLFGPEWEILK